MILSHRSHTADHQSSNFQLRLITTKGVTYLTAPALQERSIFLAFTTRFCGYSNPPFDSLNLALHVKDEQKKVLKNRQLVAKSLGFKAAKLTCAEQVHDASIEFIDEKQAGSGNDNHDNAIKAADGLITDKSDVVLGLFFADCLPVVIISLDPKIVAIAHAGYKGVLKGIASQLVMQISERAEPEHLMAFLGPSIGACCYQVEKDRIAKFSEKFPTIVNRSDKTLDLKAIVSYQLLEAGLKADKIVSSSYCTCCNSDLFFSYRRSKQTGRQAAIAFIM